jgi:hypothetical protein
MYVCMYVCIVCDTGQVSSVGVPKAWKIFASWSISEFPATNGTRNINSAKIHPADHMSTPQLNSATNQTSHLYPSWFLSHLLMVWYFLFHMYSLNIFRIVLMKKSNRPVLSCTIEKFRSSVPSEHWTFEPRNAIWLIIFVDHSIFQTSLESKSNGIEMKENTTPGHCSWREPRIGTSELFG